MADISFTGTLTVTKSGATTGATKTGTLSMTGTKDFAGEQDIGAGSGAAEQIVFPADLLSDGIQALLLYCNTSGEEISLGLSVDGSTDVDDVFAKVAYGGLPCIIKPGATAPVIYAQATSTTAKLRIVAAGA